MNKELQKFVQKKQMIVLELIRNQKEKQEIGQQQKIIQTSKLDQNLRRKYFSKKQVKNNSKSKIKIRYQKKQQKILSSRILRKKLVNKLNSFISLKIKLQKKVQLIQIKSLFTNPFQSKKQHQSYQFQTNCFNQQQNKLNLIFPPLSTNIKLECFQEYIEEINQIVYGIRILTLYDLTDQ